MKSIKMSFSALLILIAIALPLTIAFSKPLSFDNKNNLIPPACLQPFFPLLSESPSVSHVGARVNLIRCTKHHPKPMVKSSENRVSQTLADGEVYSYQYYGMTQNGLTVLKGTDGSTTGTGKFDYIFFIKHETIHNTPYLELKKLIALGDRCTGGLKQLLIDGNKVVITQYEGDNAADCDPAKTKTITVNAPLS